MAIIGIDTDTQNPSYTIDDFCFWIPKMSKFMKTEEGLRFFNKLYPIANAKVFKSVFGTDWEYAISLVIAHYVVLVGNQMSRPVGSSLAEAASNPAPQGVLTSMNVGGFSKTYDFGAILKSNTDEAMFWNQTSYGTSFYALMKSKSLPSIFVITDGNPYENQINDNSGSSYDEWLSPWGKRR